MPRMAIAPGNSNLANPPASISINIPAGVFVYLTTATTIVFAQGFGNNGLPDGKYYADVAEPVATYLANLGIATIVGANAGPSQPPQIGAPFQPIQQPLPRPPFQPVRHRF
jgi:hypothetical protein